MAADDEYQSKDVNCQTWQVCMRWRGYGTLIRFELPVNRKKNGLEAKGKSGKERLAWVDDKVTAGHERTGSIDGWTHTSFE
jgi:hypothetical protein